MNDMGDHQRRLQNRMQFLTGAAPDSQMSIPDYRRYRRLLEYEPRPEGIKVHHWLNAIREVDAWSRSDHDEG